MINRANWKLVRAYLQYRKDVDQISKSSMRLEETWLRHLLEWADDTHFREVSKIRPTFPEYMLNVRLDGREGLLSPIYIKKIVRAAQRFLRWLTVHRRGFSSLTPAWLETLKPPQMTVEPREHEAVTLGEIRAIAQAPVYTIRDRRIRAAAVFWFLSGIRIGAFVTLPLKAIDIEGMTIKQWPKYGVRTKFKKHATTHLLNIPDLIEVVKEWDEEVRSVLSPDGIWFATLSQETGEIEPKATGVGEHRQVRARKDLKCWLEKVGLPYQSPHKFRHGHAVYALKRAKDIPAIKAVSQNLMHANLSVTDGVYGVLSENDVKQQIGKLGEKVSSGEVASQAEIVSKIEQLLCKLKEKSASQI